MTLDRTFTFSQYMHINVGNKTMHTNDLFVTSLRVKGQLNECQQIFVQPKVFEPLMLQNLKLPGMIDLHVNLCLTAFGGWRSTG